MNIPIEIVAILFTAILGLQGWTLLEIVSIKVKMARYEDLEKRVTEIEHRAAHLENHRR